VVHPPTDISSEPPFGPAAAPAGSGGPGTELATPAAGAAAARL